MRSRRLHPRARRYRWRRHSRQIVALRRRTDDGAGCRAGRRRSCSFATSTKSCICATRMETDARTRGASFLSGFGIGDTHQLVNSISHGPDGSLWFTQGLHAFSRVETPWGIARLGQRRMWRLRPRTLRLEGFFNGGRRAQLLGRGLRRLRPGLPQVRRPARRLLDRARHGARSQSDGQQLDHFGGCFLRESDRRIIIPSAAPKHLRKPPRWRSSARARCRLTFKAAR